MLETKHQWLPVVLSIYLPITFIITYSIAVSNGHVEAAFPYISDTGTHAPESCVFGQLVNIGAVLDLSFLPSHESDFWEEIPLMLDAAPVSRDELLHSLAVVYIRYRHVIILYGTEPSQRVVIKINTASFIVGIIICLGVSIVGNFQETNVIIVHLIGAFMAFGIGFVYLILQTVICHKTANAQTQMPGNTLLVRRIRIALCITDFVFLIIMLVTSMTSLKKLSAIGSYNALKWTDDMPGYTEHVIATASEWVVAIVSVAFFATFYFEFKHFRVKSPELQFYESQERPQSCNISTVTP